MLPIFPLFLAAVAAFTPVDGAVSVSPYLMRKSTTDTCANINGPLTVNVGSKPIRMGIIRGCVCNSDIPHFISNDIVASTASAIAGVAATTAAIQSMIRSSGSSTCVYPDGANPVCLPTNPCAFTCPPDFTPDPPLRPTTCACLPPKSLCNGKCVTSRHCPSQHPWKRELESCPGKQTVCGIWGSSTSLTRKAWECVDTQNDAESCGGCMVEFGRSRATGIDCTTIPNVSDVSCQRGKCVVKSCIPGYDISADGMSCMHQDISLVEAEVFAALSLAGLKRE